MGFPVMQRAKPGAALFVPMPDRPEHLATAGRVLGPVTALGVGIFGNLVCVRWLTLFALVPHRSAPRRPSPRCWDFRPANPGLRPAIYSSGLTERENRRIC